MPRQAGHHLHATTIALNRCGALIVGASGSGKSSLALQMIALGAVLVADDQTILHRQDGALLANPAENLAGMIEARGIGILRMAFVSQCRVDVVIDLDEIETERLPAVRTREVLGVDLPELHKVATDACPHALCAYLSNQRMNPDHPHG